MNDQDYPWHLQFNVFFDKVGSCPAHVGSSIFSNVAHPGDLTALWREAFVRILKPEKPTRARVLLWVPLLDSSDPSATGRWLCPEPMGSTESHLQRSLKGETGFFGRGVWACILNSGSLAFYPRWCFQLCGRLLQVPPTFLLSSALPAAAWASRPQQGFPRHGPGVLTGLLYSCPFSPSRCSSP